MRFTVEYDNALRLIYSLAKRGEDVRVDAKVLAADEQVPIRFALKILRKLRQHGLINSFRGNQGGYSLAKPASEITMKDVYEAIDGEMCMIKCIGNPSECNLKRAAICPVHYYVCDLQHEISSKLDKVSIQSFIDRDELIL